MKIMYGSLLLLCLGLAACADRNPGVALGVGSHGAGVAVFTDSGWLGVGPFGGLMVGFGGSRYDYDDGTGYSSGRIVRQPPAPSSSPPPPAPSASAARPLGKPLHMGYDYPSALDAYRTLR